MTFIELFNKTITRKAETWVWTCDNSSNWRSCHRSRPKFQLFLPSYWTTQLVPYGTHKKITEVTKTRCTKKFHMTFVELLNRRTERRVRSWVWNGADSFDLTVRPKEPAPFQILLLPLLLVLLLSNLTKAIWNKHKNHIDETMFSQKIRLFQHLALTLFCLCGFLRSGFGSDIFFLLLEDFICFCLNLL